MNPTQESEGLLEGMKAHRAGRLGEARARYEAVLRQNPRHPQALNLMGLVSVAEKRTEDGIGFFEASLEADPAFAAAWSNLGSALMSVGRGGDAVVAHKRAVELDPGSAAVHTNLGIALDAMGRRDEAALSFMRAVDLEPRMAEAHNNLGNVRRAQGDLGQAAGHYLKALEVRANYPDAWCNLGNVLLEDGRPHEAEEAFARALRLDPRLARAHNKRSEAFRALGRFSEALAASDAALKLEPDFSEAQTNRGCALQALQQWDEALEAHRRAAEGRGGDPAVAWNNLGNCLLSLNRTQEALDSYRRARSLLPSSPSAEFNESLVHLVEGRLLQGWEGYEKRWELKARNLRKRPVQDRPSWDGRESLDGRSIVVYSEQGLGDTFQFARYIPLLAERGAKVHAVVQPAARSLISRVAGVHSASTPGEPWPDCDFHCPLLSLPRAFRTEIASIPSNVPYLAADPEHARKAGERMPVGRRRIGFVWAGNPGNPNDRNRSLPADILLGACAAPGTARISLQKDLRPGEAAFLEAAGVVDLSGFLSDFEATAGVLSQMDLVISVDTSVAHLAGAMGVPTWVLLPFSPDWRWLLGREDSPWYPSVRLFRQPSPGDWRSVLVRVAGELDT